MGMGKRPEYNSGSVGRPQGRLAAGGSFGGGRAGGRLLMVHLKQHKASVRSDKLALLAGWPRIRIRLSELDCWTERR